MTTNNEAFEKWAKDHEYAIDDYVYALEIWQAAKSHFEETWLIENEKKILALESNINHLREALHKAQLKLTYGTDEYVTAGKALSATPATPKD